ncbi:MAG: DNA repair protein RadA [Oscillospiraceae bacterium]
MGKLKSIYVCSSCGYESPKWYGKCPECGDWNTFTEEVRTEELPSKQKTAGLVEEPAADSVMSISDVLVEDEYRYITGISELDRVLGGGIVKGSVTLLGGDPGIGKSTMLLQICGRLCDKMKILYVSGEESKAQLKLRAKRLGVSSKNLLVAPYTDLGQVINAITTENPDMVMIDSIQTMNFSAISSSSGSVTQVKECTSILTKIAKNVEIPVIIVGHVNKDGAIAGPKVMEHIVDTVLYFEGERTMSYRILRAVKNRFGSTNEIGVFAMDENGLKEVENPSTALLSERPTNVSGTCVSCIIEGTRPIFAEVQALVAKTGFGVPRRTSTGFDLNRTALLIAVLEKRAGYYFGSMDTYINVIGGLKLDEPAADLAVAIALISSLTDTVVDSSIVAFGEVGLGGELRSVSHAESRIKEAEKLGFSEIILPKQCIDKLSKNDYSIKLSGVSNVSEAFSVIKRKEGRP